MRHLALLGLLLGSLASVVGQSFIPFERDTVFWWPQDDSLATHTGDARNAEVVILTSLGSSINYRVEDGYIVSRIVINAHGIMTAEALYKEGKLHGLHRIWTKDGTLQVSGQYEEGMESGNWTYYRRNGTRQLSGRFLADPSAQVEDLEFMEHLVDEETGEQLLIISNAPRHSPPHGQWIFYDRDGKVAGIVAFDKGRLSGLHYGDVW
jgi:hypothetical protein